MTTPDLTPHDRLFRTVFQVPEHASGLVQPLVPAPVAARIDWSTLNLESGTFVDEGSSRNADLLFSARMDDGRSVLIFLLTEHQSSPDHLMSIRMAGYVVRALERYVDAHGKPRQLPAVLPLVVSHCERSWSARLDLHELYDLDQHARETLAPHLLGIRYIVDDLSAQTEEAIRRRALTAQATVALLALRAVRITRLFADPMARWADLLRTLSPAELGPVLVYALQTGEDAPEALRDVLHSLVSPEAGELTMTTAERLIQEGEARGEVRGMARVLLTQLALKRIDVPEAIRERIAVASPEQLERWAQRVIAASTLAEVFEGDVDADASP